MRIASSALAALAAVALVSSSAFAQYEGMSHTRPRMFHIGVGGGVSVPTADAKDFLENGWNGQAWVSFTPPIIPISFRAAFDLQKSKFKSNVQGPSVPSVPGTPTLGSDASNQVLAGLANARINLLRGPFQPYITVGLGGYSVKAESDSSGFSKSSVKFGINGGAGLSIQIKKICFYIEGRVDNVYTDKGVIDTKTIQLVPVTFGIAY